MPKQKPTTSEAGYNSLRNRLGHYIVGAILVIAGPAWAIYSWLGVSEARASQTWPTARGQITDSKLWDPENIFGQQFEVKVRYAFVVDGKKFTGDRLKIGGKSTSVQADAEADANRYDTAEHVQVSYDPSDPNRSTLETGITNWKLFTALAPGPALLLLGLFLIAVGGLMSLLARAKEAAVELSDDDDEEERPRSTKPKPKPADQDEEDPPPPKKKKRPTADEGDDEPPPKRKSR